MNGRSKEREIMDLGPSFYSNEEYLDCLKLLFKVNVLLGFFKTTVKLLKRFPEDVSVVDVGCGGGLFLLNLSKHYPGMTLLGMDVSATAIALAERELTQWKKNNTAPKLTFEVQKQLTFELPKDSVDIVLTTLVCHHIDDDALVVFLQNAHHAARKAVIINDLQRHRLAYWFYKQISPLLFRNRLITHDGLVSIQRSFTRSELQGLMLRANINNYQLKWRFPFRWSIVLWPN